MGNRATAVLCMLVMTQPGWTTPREDCQKKMNERIDRLDKIMRQGYSLKEGNRLNALRRELSRIRAACARDPEGWKRAPKP